LQQHSSISVYNTAWSEDDNIVFEKSITFHHFFCIRVNLYSSQSFKKLTKAIYAELFRLLKKTVDYAIKADMQYELSNIFKTFIYDIQNKINDQKTENLANICNPTVIKHKGWPLKRLKASAKQFLFKGKQMLKDSSRVNIREDNGELNVIEDETNNIRGQKCGRCKQYRHYAKTCQSI